MKSFSNYLGAFIVFLLVVPILADTVILKNGQSISGEIIYQDSDSVKLKNAIGEQTILKKNIRRIVFKDVHKAEDLAREQKEREESEKNRLESEQEKQRQLEQQKADAEKAEVEKRDQVARLQKENGELRAKVTAQENAQAERTARAGWPSVWRSVVLPGWGQVYRGDKIRGGVFMGASAFSFLYWYDLNRKYRAASNDYKTASQIAIFSGTSVSPNIIATGFVYANDKRNRMQSIAGRANFAAALFISTYAWNVVDAFANRSGGQSVAGFRTEGLTFSFAIPFN